MLRLRLWPYCASKRQPRSSNRYPPRLSSRYPPRPRSTCPVGRGSDAPWTVSLAGQVLLPRPFDTLVNATPGPYVPGGSREAFAFNVSVMVTPPVSVEPKLELAVSQDGVLIE